MIDYLKHWVKIIIKKDYRASVKLTRELNKIKDKPRFVPFDILLFERKFRIVDSASFTYMYQEIFQNEIYKFRANSETPFIIDCGANIGLSIIYFQKLYPKAEILAFEPDEGIFNVLKNNVQLNDRVNLINKALWHEETSLTFFVEGADGGNLFEGEKSVVVQTDVLSKYITKSVDLLKMDIEGAETEVLNDCKDLLYLVKNLFVEYHSFVNKPQSLNNLLNILTQAGFRLHIQEGGLISKQPFLERKVDYNMDLQLNIFAFRD